MRQALEEERERGVALTRSLAAGRQEIEARGVLVAEIRQASEAVARQLRQALEEERGRVGALTRDLAAARREIEARTALTAAVTEATPPAKSVTRNRGGRWRKNARGSSCRRARPRHSAIRRAETRHLPASCLVGRASPDRSQETGHASGDVSKLGDISAARILLGRALDMGSAEAGFRLAESYDPVVLSARRALGTHGDRARARELYTRAYEAGIHEAKDRMDALR